MTGTRRVCHPGTRARPLARVLGLRRACRTPPGSPPGGGDVIGTAHDPG